MIGVAPVIFSSFEAVADAADRVQVGRGEAAGALEDDHHRHLFAWGAVLVGWLLEDLEGAGRFGVLGQEAGLPGGGDAIDRARHDEAGDPDRRARPRSSPSARAAR